MSFRTSAGTPTDPASSDTEFSSDGGASFSDCAEEITTGGGNGMGYLTLTGAETNNRMLLIASKSSNCLTTPAILHPKVLPIISSGTLSAGSSGGGTLGTVLGYDITGCFIRTTGGTGGGGTGGANNQARRIVTYDTATGAFTVSTWETTPNNTTTYDILLPEGATLGSLKAVNPTTPGRTLDVSAGGEAGLDWANIGSPATTVALTGTTVGTVTTVTNQLTAAQIATGVWQDATAGDFTTAGSIGKGLFTSGAVPGASGGLTIAGANAATTFATLTSTGAFTVGSFVNNGVTDVAQTGDSFARIGATGSGLTSLAPASTALSTATWTNGLATNIATTNTTVASNLNAAITSRQATFTAATGVTFPSNFSSSLTLPTDDQLVKTLAAVYDSAVGSGGNVLTLSNGATQTIDLSTGSRTTA